MDTLRAWFGPSRAEIWKLLSEAVNGRFVEGGFFKAPRVEVEHGPWVLTLDTYTVSTGKVSITFTRMRAPYVNPDSFRFGISPRNFFTPFATLLGMQDLAVGDPGFDEAFVVKATDPLKVRQLLDDKKLRDLIFLQPGIRLEVRDHDRWFVSKFPDGVDELCFQVRGVVKDLEQLKSIFDLFAETLDQLCRIGSAYRQPAGVTL